MKKRAHKIKLKLIELFIVKPLKLLPLKDIIIFESHSDFSDNSKALFNKIIEEGINNKFEMYWLVENINSFQNKKIKNVKFVSLKRNTFLEKIISEFKNAILLSRCKYYFFSHVNYARSNPKKGQVYFNLTHGTSLKDSTGLNANAKNTTYILSKSDFTAKLRVITFEGGKEKIQILGFPRNDLLFNNNNCLKLLDINKNENKKVVIWMPTFRRHAKSGRNDTGTNQNSDLPILKDENDIHNLENYLTSKNIIIIIKPHPAQDLSHFKAVSTNNIKFITNDKLLEKEIELYELLGETDALITDYSSVYMDYLILDKPIGFTIDDINEYGNTLGFLVEDPLNYMPGPKIKTLDDMINFLEQISIEADSYKEERARVCKIFNKYTDNKSSDRILEFLDLKK